MQLQFSRLHEALTSLSPNSVAQVKQLAVAQGTPLAQTEPAPQPADSESTNAAVESKQEPTTDPTISNAGLTEVDDGSAAPLTNGHHHHPQAAASSSSSSSAAGGALGNADVGDSAANAAGESQWDTTATQTDLTASQEWVDVKIPREPSETETGLAATPAAPANTQSWADDHPEASAAAAEAAAPSAAPAAAPPADDGFQSVQGRQRGNREGGGEGGGRGGWRGRGGYRGRGGFRGEGRGRGRGGPRGGGMTPRPRRGGEEH